MENLRRYSSLLHAIPVLPAIADKRMGISGVFDVVSLGEVVKEIVDLLRRSLMNDGKEKVLERVRLFYYISGRDLQLDYVRSLVAKAEYRGGIGEMNVARWAQKACELGMHSTIVALFD